MKTEQCEPVLYPPTAEEIAAASRDPLQARVVRPREVNPVAPPPNSPAARVTEDFDLSAYTYRGPESGVRTGGLRGRWYVSLTDSASVDGRRVRPQPVVLDAGQPLQIVPRLATGSLTAVIGLSGSTDAGRALIDEWAASPEVLADIAAARTRNPHLGPVGNGRFRVTGSGDVLVGCTLPKILVNLDGLDDAYREQANPLWKAGVARMDWIFSDESFRPDDLYRQINWTLTDAAEPVSGSWELWPYGWADPGYDASKTAIATAITRWSQPSGSYGSTGDDPVAQNRKRLVGFFQEVTPLWNRINSDSNTIRGLQIAGGNTRMTRQPIRFPEYNGIPAGNSTAPATTGSVTTSAPAPASSTAPTPAPTPTPTTTATREATNA